MRFGLGLGARGWRVFLEGGLLLVLPLVFHRGFAEQFSYPKVFLTKTLTLAGLLVWAAGLLRAGRPKLPPWRVIAPMAAWALAVGVSCLNSPVPAFSFAEAASFFCGPVWFLLLLSTGEGEAVVRRVAFLGAMAGTLVAIVGLTQRAGLDPLLFGGYRVDWGTMVPRMRLYSTFGNPNFVAGYLIGVVFLPLVLGILSSSPWGRGGWFASAAVVSVAIVGTGSRGAWLGLALGLLAAIAVWRLGDIAGVVRKRDKRRGPGMAAFALLPLVGALGLLSGTLLEALLGRLEGRVYLWRVSWPMFAEHPLLGSGFGTFQLRFLDLQARFLAEHPDQIRYWSHIRQLHNDPLQLLLETGLVGFAAFAGVLWWYMRQMRTASEAGASREARVWVAASAGGVAALLANSLFNFQLSIPPTFILLFTLMAFPPLLRGNRSEGREQGSQEHGERAAALPPSRNTRLGIVRVLFGIVLLVGGAGAFSKFVDQAAAERDYSRALRYEALGEHARAEEAYRRGVSRNGLSGRLHFGLARVLYLERKYPEALSEAKIAKRTYADSHLQVLEARIQDQMGLAEAALASYRRALALDPTLKTVQADIERLSR